MQAVGGGVGKILPHAAVKVDVHQAGNHIAPGGVQNLVVPAGRSDLPAVGKYIPGEKALFQVEDLAVDNSDTYCFGNDINAWNIPELPWKVQSIPSEEPWTGSLVLENYNINHECEIYQVFIQKQNLIKSSNYQIVLYNTSGNEIYRQYQDNGKYQLITSFTLDKPLSNVGSIIILDGDGNRVYIENSLYVITRAGTQFLME